MTPYYRSPDGAIVVYHARWEDVVAAGHVPLREVALVHADPPYGTSERCDRLKKGRTKACAARDFAPIFGDGEPHNPLPLLALQRPMALWGANHFCSSLPGSPSWIVWDKRDGGASDDNADGEAAWTNLGGPLRIFRHRWRGMIKASERSDVRLGPMQKPIALSTFVFAHAKLQRGDLVFVPYLGSGPDLAACVAAGLRCIACEVVEEYCRVAVGARLHAAPVVETPGPLFATRSRAP